MKSFTFDYPIFIEDLNLSKSYIKNVKNKKLKQYDFNENNFFDKEDINFSLETNKEIQQFLLKVTSTLSYTEYKLEKTWIQKYKENDFHDCHIHGVNTFSFILYIDCTDKSSKTQFYNMGYPYISNKTFTVSPKIGRCIIFDGAIPHAVLPNKDNKRLVVSGNIVFE